MTESQINFALEEIKNELLRANKIHGDLFNSAHEGHSVIREEVEEMWDDVKHNMVAHSILECIQVGAMAVKYIVSMTEKIDKQANNDTL